MIDSMTESSWFLILNLLIFSICFAGAKLDGSSKKEAALLSAGFTFVLTGGVLFFVSVVSIFI